MFIRFFSIHNLWFQPVIISTYNPWFQLVMINIICDFSTALENFACGASSVGAKVVRSSKNLTNLIFKGCASKNSSNLLFWTLAIECSELSKWDSGQYLVVHKTQVFLRNRPGVFVRVTRLLPWITENTGIKLKVTEYWPCNWCKVKVTESTAWHRILGSK